MSHSIPLHELNAHLFAAILPETHGKKAKLKKGEQLVADPQPDAPPPLQFSEEQIAACEAAGVDPSTLSAEEMAAVVAAANLGK